MKILVYDVAASVGGALTVLEDYHGRALSDKENDYVFVLSTPNLTETDNVTVLNYPFVKKGWLSRLRFDLCVMPSLIRRLNPDRILSLQNTLVPFVRKEQWVYMHNLLPRDICDMRFSMRSEPVLWVYQNVIGRVIARSLRRADKVIVQSEWLKERCSKQYGIPAERIKVERPSSAPFEMSCNGVQKDEEVVFFYPASSASYKNHRVILDACSCLKNEGIDGYRVVFTLSGSEGALSESLKARSEEEDLPIQFCGHLGREEMGAAYMESNVLLFPSRLETWGLPLQEAQQFGLEIIASDLDYARETIDGYDQAYFFDPTNPRELAGLMRDLVARKQSAAISKGLR